MITNFYLVRHAHSAYTRDERGRPLSDQGVHDAKKAAGYLEKERIDEVLSSPYKRAIQTVEQIAHRIGREIIMEEGFRERILSDEPVLDFQAAIKRVWEDPEFFLGGGESNCAAQARVSQAALTLLDKYKGKNLVIGTHGNIMVLLMNYFDKSYGYSFWKNLAMPDIYKLSFEDSRLAEVSRVWKEAE
ncbi:histidine phosphatase family protein [Peribacillus kribbensis]|uniref:histidine phosphatase family protein n=1 Tax=Peribacillus kribbensis TaxID=356658 RepID=UPI000423E8B4|nr:histidine phosphatase family protein [Peribacillus kribbensis]